MNVMGKNCNDTPLFMIMRCKNVASDILYLKKLSVELVEYGFGPTRNERTKVPGDRAGRPVGDDGCVRRNK